MKRFAVLTALAAAVAAGCVAPPRVMSKEVAAKVSRADERVFVENINEAVLPDGTLKVSVVAVSQVEFPLSVQYRTNWYDRNGQPMSTSVSQWQTKQIDGGQRLEFVVTGPGPKAASYSFEFRTE